MKDETEGMELVRDESLGSFYSATDLKALADDGAKLANETADGYSISTEWLTLPKDHTEFVVRCRRQNGFAELLIKVDAVYAKRGGIATRTLRLYGSTEEPLLDETLEPLELETDGNPTAFVIRDNERHKLSQSELIRELVLPVIEAARN